jgi:DNA mismatch endonuclease (patch repair protein)
MTPNTPTLTRPADSVRRRMQMQAERNTQPEIALRRALHRLGLRFRLERQVVPGTRRRVDITFGPSKVAVMVDGCFWHGCPDHGTLPVATNRTFWEQKVARNRERDQDTDARLIAEGWIVERVWEHEDSTIAADRIAALVRRRRPSPEYDGSPDMLSPRDPVR